MVRPQPGQSLLGPFPGPRPGRAGRRRARHQPADQPRAARCPGPAPGREQVRPRGADPHHHGVARPISYRPRSRTRPTSTTSRTIRGLCSSASTPRCCSTWCARRPACPRSSRACRRARGPSSCGTARCRTTSSSCSAGPCRVSACECERNSEPSVGPGAAPAQLTGDHAKLSHDAGTVARLVQAACPTTGPWSTSCT